MAKKRAPKKSTALARVPSSPSSHVYAPAAEPGRDQMFIRVPIPPDVVLAVREHVENGTKLLDLFARITEVPPGEIVETIQRAASAVSRDVARIQRARKRRATRR